jgi:hypothetical protein
VKRRFRHPAINADHLLMQFDSQGFHGRGGDRMRFSLRCQEFDQIITLRDSYRVMERFLKDYLARGDTAVSDLLYVYGGLTATDETPDPAALGDYLASARTTLGEGKRIGPSS